MSEPKWTRHDDTYYASSYRGWKLRVDARWAGWQWIIERVELAGEKTIVGGVEETQREAQDAAIAEVDRRMGQSVSDTLSLQLSLTTLVAYAQQLPPDYHISIRLLRHGYTIEVIDPDGTSLAEVATPRLFVELILMAQMDAMQRAADGVH